jgi:hypothetical protein
LLFMSFFVIVTMFVVVIIFCKLFLSIIFFVYRVMARKCHHHAPSWNIINYMYFICSNGYMPPPLGMLLHASFHFLVVIIIVALTTKLKRGRKGVGGAGGRSCCRLQL